MRNAICLMSLCSIGCADIVSPSDLDAAADGVCGARASPLRRLSHAEYQNAVHDLFAGTEVPLTALVADVTTGEFENDAASLAVNSLLVAQYGVSAETIAARVAEDTSLVLPCPSGETGCAALFIEVFGQRAFRRPLTEEERADFLEIFTVPPADSDFDTGVKLTLEALLQSPQFLYRIDEASAADENRVDAFSLASRLSFFLWGSIPDEGLLAAAASGALDTDEGLATEVDRMLADPRAEARFQDFARQWLELDRLDDTTKIEADGFDGAMRASMRGEAERFFSQVVYRGTLEDLLTSKETFMNEDLASLYGVPMTGETDDEGFAAVRAPDDRGGILTQPWFLASHAHPLAPSPVLRGVFVLRRLTCSQLDDPPAGANTTPPSAPSDGTPTTNRERYEAATGATQCQGCHSAINPIGFAFEQYDTMGRRRTIDNGLPIDTSGDVFGLPVDGMAELRTALTKDQVTREQVESCASQKLVTFAFGGLDPQDDCLVSELAAGLRAGKTFASLFRTLALGDEMRSYQVAP